VTGARSAGAVLLACEQLSVRRGEREVLHDVSIDVRAGELVALLGPNGAGKSTLMEALAGSLPAAAGTWHGERSGPTSSSHWAGGECHAHSAGTAPRPPWPR
jgi:iron complex transport system ATP-binding protein